MLAAKSPSTNEVEYPFFVIPEYPLTPEYPLNPEIPEYPLIPEYPE